jgi:hypothetical protein
MPIHLEIDYDCLTATIQHLQLRTDITDYTTTCSLLATPLEPPY